MAEIKIEKKKPIWPWILALLVIALIVYFLFFKDTTVITDENTTKNDTIVDRTEMVDDGYVNDNASAVAAFVALVKNDNGNMTLDHTYSHNMLTKLIDATEEVSSKTNFDSKMDLEKAREHADMITKDSQATDHAEHIKKSTDMISTTLHNLQKAKFPALTSEAEKAKMSSDAIDVKELALNQKNKSTMKTTDKKDTKETEKKATSATTKTASKTVEKSAAKSESKSTATAKSGGKEVKAKKSAAEDLREFFVDALKDIYWAEKALTKALPKMSKNATSKKLIEALNSHLIETEGQIERLQQVFEMIGEKAVAKKCEAMAGLIKEGEEILEETEPGAVRDAGIIAASQKIEHYEIATYGTLCAYAKTLGEIKAGKLLHESLEEEKAADKTLTEAAYNDINFEAAEA